MNTVISVKIDKEVKESAQSVAKSAGLTLSAIINAYLRQVVATRRIEIYAPEEMSPQLERMVAKSEKDLNSNLVSRKFNSVDDLLSDLNK